MFRRAFVAICASLAFSVAACGDDSTGNTNEPSIEGTFQLRTVNGMAVPTSGILRFTDGTLVLNPNRTWNIDVNYQATEGTTTRQLSYRDNGTYEFTGSAFRLTSAMNNGAQYTGSALGEDRTVTVQGYVYVFKR